MATHTASCFSGLPGVDGAWARLLIAEQVGNLFLGVATAYFLWFLALYLAKSLTRPKVVLEDMAQAPARAGIAAAAMCMMLAVALLPLGVAGPGDLFVAQRSVCHQLCSFGL